MLCALKPPATFEDAESAEENKKNNSAFSAPSAVKITPLLAH